LIVKKYMSGEIVQTFESNSGECLDIDWIPDIEKVEYTGEFDTKLEDLPNEKLKKLWCDFILNIL
jgi:hypothetical protein